jgi:hypothetical protein
MRRSLLALLVIFFGFNSCPSQAQNPAPDTVKPAVDKKMNGLMIYGEGFYFSVKEPDGWNSDVDKVARYYYSNIIFLPENKSSRAAHVNIRIRVNHKETTDPSEDMQTDMDGYKKQNPKVKFADLAVSHPKYMICAKLFYQENDYYEYVVYVDPGPGVTKNFSVSMSKESTPATPEEMKAFKEILESLFWWPVDVHVQKTGI